MSDYVVACVPPDLAEKALPHVRQMLKKSHMVGAYNEEALLKDLKDKFVLLWVCVRDGSIEAAMTTTLIKLEGGGLACQILALGGRNMKGWRALWPQIESYAKNEGCCKVRVEGRLGWKRILADYVQTGVILEKRMT
jgi:hypothetical protein